MKHEISKYTDVVPYKDQYALFNKTNGILITLESEHIYKKGNDYIVDTVNDDIYDYLKSNDFFIDDLTVRKSIKTYIEPKEIGLNVTVVISLTERCNCSCSYCYQKNWDKNNSMPEEEYYHSICSYLRQVVSKMREKGRLIIRYFGGEPMLKKQLMLKINQFITKLIEESSKIIHVVFELDTNYTLIDTDFILQFPNLSIATCLSMPKDHNTLRGNSFSSAFSNLLATKSVFDMQKYKLNIGYNVHSGNIKDFEPFLKLIRRSGIECDIYLTNIVNYQGTSFFNSLTTHEFDNVCIDELYPLLYKYDFSIEDLLPRFGLSRKCPGFDTLSAKLYSNGIKSMCSLFSKELINIIAPNDKSNPTFLNLLPERCIICYDYPYCGGIRPCITCNGIYENKEMEFRKILQYIALHEGK